MITETQPVPVFGRDGEPCPACGAPLAGDQRYCLHCGVRRPEARLEFLDVLDADVHTRATGFAPAPLAAAPAGGGGLNARLQANAGLLALAALLMLMLVVGLLLGHWATGEQQAPAAAAPTPQVIRVEGAAAPATDAGSGGDAAGATTDAGSGNAKTAKAKKSGAAEKATAPKDAVSVKDLNSKKAVDDAVKKGKPISTGSGKLPPKDDKPAGGGSSFEEIG